MQALVPFDAAPADVTVVDGRPGEPAVSAAARRFELPALLRLLRRRGYVDEDIYFESVRGAPAAPGLVDSLRFEDSPRRVIVRLSVGLLTPDGPLPSYFRRFVEDLGDPRPFLAFLRFFDHVVAANLSYVAHPVDGVARRSPLPRAYQTIGGARSPARVHALVRAIVPELEVEVFPAALSWREAGAAARLGQGRLDGTAVVGGVALTRVHGLVARLWAESEHDDGGRPWIDVVRARLGARLAPLVRGGARTLEVRLHVGSYGGRAGLGGGVRLGTQPIASTAPRPWELLVMRLGPRGGAA